MPDTDEIKVEHFAFYGTLQNLDAPGLLERVGTCLLPGDLYDHGPFPAMVKGETQTHAVLWRVVDERPIAMKALLFEFDRIESYYADDPIMSLYLREPVEAILDTGETVVTWTYYWNTRALGLHSLTRVESGRWRPTSDYALPIGWSDAVRPVMRDNPREW